MPEVNQTRRGRRPLNHGRRFATVAAIAVVFAVVLKIATPVSPLVGFAATFAVAVIVDLATRWHHHRCIDCGRRGEHLAASCDEPEHSVCPECRQRPTREDIADVLLQEFGDSLALAPGITRAADAIHALFERDGAS